VAEAMISVSSPRKYVHTVSSKITQMYTMNDCLLDTDVLPYLTYQIQATDKTCVKHMI